MRQILETKMVEALKELKLRSLERESSISDVQRMYGVVLGIRMVTIEFNRAEGVPKHDYFGSLIIERMLEENFGKMNRSEMKGYFK